MFLFCNRERFLVLPLLNRYIGIMGEEQIDLSTVFDMLLRVVLPETAGHRQGFSARMISIASESRSMPAAKRMPPGEKHKIAA
jgi:hypothetical protein